ncbi:MAG: HNH endonuclease [bacterium]
MSRRHHLRLLWAAATDATWHRVEHHGRRVLTGKCIHCNRKLTLAPDGAPGPGATLEHIVPRTHGGTNDLDNLAIACGRCNGQKGVRLDVRALDDPTLQAVITTLQTRRAERRRPRPRLAAPPAPPRARRAAPRRSTLPPRPPPSLITPRRPPSPPARIARSTKTPPAGGRADRRSDRSPIAATTGGR